MPIRSFLIKKTYLILIFIASIGSTILTKAAELNGVTMPEQKTVEAKTLILNGLGLRKVTKFGFPIKVYVAGLYLEKKTSNADELINSTQLRRIEMQFLRGLQRDQIVEAWQTAFEDNCFAECKESKSVFNKQFLVKFRGVSEKQIMALNLYADKVTVEFPGEPLATVADANLVKNIAAIFFGKKPPNKELKDGMLGVSK